MIKDILVTLPTGDAPSIALDYAVTVASTFDAHLTGVAFVQDLAAMEHRLMVQRRLCWIAIVEKWKPPLRVPKSGSKKRRQREGLSAESMVLTAASGRDP